VRGCVGFVKSRSAACCPVERRKETYMDDMIGASGMLRGWAMMGHMYLVWLPALLLVSVAVTAVIESLIASLRPRLVAPKFVLDHAALEIHMRVERR
jgi:hypothetical protein